MKHFLILLSSCLSGLIGLAQTHRIDSLKQILQTAKNERERLQATLTLCEEFESLPKDTLWNDAVNARELATAAGDARGMSLSVVALANAYLRWDNADSARAWVEPELAKYHAETPGTRELYFKLAQLKIDCMGDGNDYKDAIAQVYEVMRYAEKYKDSVVLAESMNTLCAFNYDMDFLGKSKDWGYKALSYTQNTPKFYRVISSICYNLGQNYWWTGKEDSAAYFADRDIDISSRLDNLLYLSRAYELRANICVRQKDYKQAELAILEGIRLIRKTNGNVLRQEDLITLSNVYRSSGRLDKAIAVLKNGLIADSLFQDASPHAKRTTEARDLQRIFYYQSLAQCYRARGDSKNYEACLEKVIEGKDAFYTANSAQAIAELETKYEVQKKEATISQQRLSLIKSNYLFYGSILFSLLSAIIVWLIFREFRRKQILRLRQLQEEERVLSAKAVADAEETERKRIATDLHDNLGAQLSFIKRNVNFIMDQPAGFSRENERKYLSTVNDIAQNAMIDLRETLWVLNKDEVKTQEFADKLKSYLRQQLIGKDSIQWDFQEEIGAEWKLPSGEVMHIFRIVQEVISNVIKHAEASLIRITFESRSPNTYQLEIFDNGKGFEPSRRYEGHYGLENIGKRAKEISATLLIASNASSGTHIVLRKGKNNANALFPGYIDFLTFIK